jgi:hypothetical protein
MTLIANAEHDFFCKAFTLFSLVKRMKRKGLFDGKKKEKKQNKNKIEFLFTSAKLKLFPFEITFCPRCVEKSTLSIAVVFSS